MYADEGSEDSEEVEEAANEDTSEDSIVIDVDEEEVEQWLRRDRSVDSRKVGAKGEWLNGLTLHVWTKSCDIFALKYSIKSNNDP